MANEEQLKLLKNSVSNHDIEIWNNWKRNQMMPPNLGGANLSLIDLSGVDLEWATLMTTNFKASKLVNSNLMAAHMQESNLTETDLTKANLTMAHLDDAKIYRADLTDAILFKANLIGATIHRANLTRTNLCETRWGFTDIVGVNLAIANISNAEIQDPCSVGTDTIQKTALSLQNIPNRIDSITLFFKKCGIPGDQIDLFQRWLVDGKFYSVFISYNHNDISFARILFDTLKSKGISCWLDEKKMIIGNIIEEEIDNAIYEYDKLLLICSKSSLSSTWVEAEYEKAIAKEKLTGRQVIMPLVIDDYLFDEPNVLNIKIKKRLAGDFRNWKQNNLVIERGVDSIIKALSLDSTLNY